MNREFLELFEVIWCPQHRKGFVFGVMVASASSENHEHKEFSGFPKRNRKVTDPK